MAALRIRSPLLHCYSSSASLLLARIPSSCTLATTPVSYHHHHHHHHHHHLHHHNTIHQTLNNRARNFATSSARMTVLKIESTNLFAEAMELSKTKLVVVDFFAVWCGPCKVIAPQVENLSNEFADKASFYKLDVDEQALIAAEQGVRAMPTFLFFKGGMKVDEVVGANPKALRAGIEKHL